MEKVKRSRIPRPPAEPYQSEASTWSGLIIHNAGQAFVGGTVVGSVYHLLKTRSLSSALASAPRVGGAYAVLCTLTFGIEVAAYCFVRPKEDAIHYFFAGSVAGAAFFSRCRCMAAVCAGSFNAHLCIFGRHRMHLVDARSKDYRLSGPPGNWSTILNDATPIHQQHQESQSN